MRLLLSKLTTKYQATIPLEVRKILNLHSKDRVAYEIRDDNTVVIRKASPLDIDYLHALESTLTEWESQEDENAYKFL